MSLRRADCSRPRRLAPGPRGLWYATSRGWRFARWLLGTPPVDVLVVFKARLRMQQPEPNSQCLPPSMFTGPRMESFTDAGETWPP